MLVVIIPKQSNVSHHPPLYLFSCLVNSNSETLPQNKKNSLTKNIRVSSELKKAENDDP